LIVRFFAKGPDLIMEGTVAIFLFWLILAICVGAWASSRGHSGFGMFLLSVLLSPLIGFIIEAVRAPNRAEVENREVATGAMKKCPACAELVRAEATKCRYCGEALAVQTVTAQRQCSTCGAVYTSAAAQNCARCGEALGAVASGNDEGAGKAFGG
jgi:hypothetical protein